MAEEAIQKKKFKMPTAFSILLILSMVAAIATHIVPAGTYDYKDDVPVAGTYHLVEPNPQGLYDVMQAPISGFADALPVALFILVLGGFLGIVFETKAMDAALGRVVTKFRGREKLMIPILMICFMLGGTTFGMAEETIAFYPLIIPIVMAAGYDPVTAIMIIFLGSGCGVLGGLVDPFAVGIGSEMAGISLGEGMEFRAILLVLSEAVAIAFTMWYAERVRKDPSKSITADINDKLVRGFHAMSGEPVEFTPKRVVVLIIFALTFIIMTISVIPWESKFGITFFADIHEGLKSIPGMGLLMGAMLPLGDWYFTETTTLFFFSSILVALVYRIPEERVVSLFMDGVKDLISVALVLGVARGISVILSDGMILGTILHAGEVALSGISTGVFAIFTYLLYIPLTFLLPSTSGLATASIPIMAPLADFAGVSRAVVVMAFQAGAETMNFISPTQCVLMGALAITGVPYSR